MVDAICEGAGVGHEYKYFITTPAIVVPAQIRYVSDGSDLEEGLG